MSVFLVGCSKGTYIRSLAHDIGQELGVGAYLTQLRRTKIGEYSVEEASGKFLSNEFFIFGNLDYICVRYQIMMIKTAKHIKTFLASMLLLIFVMNVSGLFVRLHHQETHQKTEKIAECSDKVCYHKAHLQTKSDCDCGFFMHIELFLYSSRKTSDRVSCK